MEKSQGSQETVATHVTKIKHQYTLGTSVIVRTQLFRSLPLNVSFTPNVSFVFDFAYYKVLDPGPGWISSFWQA